MKNYFLFFFVIILLSCNGQEPNKDIKETSKTCIEKILEEDSSYGGIRNHSCEKISLSKTIDNYTESLDKMDFSDCPKPFSEAFKKHIDAWRAMKNVTDKYPELRGELHDLFAVIETKKDSTAFKGFHKNIWDTWKDIETAMGE